MGGLKNEVEEEEIDASCTDEITCPYCGFEFGDSWEYNFNNGEEIEQCPECNKHFSCNRDVVATYYSSKVPCMNGEGEHEWRFLWHHEPTNKFTYQCNRCNKREQRDKKS
jgi:hypothetical protein